MMVIKYNPGYYPWTRVGATWTQSGFSWSAFDEEANVNNDDDDDKDWYDYNHQHHESD